MKKALVIEDEEKARWAFEQFLKGAGYTPLLAETAEQGIEIAKAERPSVVICDVKLPGMSGLDALPLLKKASPDADVIVMTAYGDPQTVIEAIQRGAIDYLTKPLDLNRLKTLLARMERSGSTQASSAPAKPQGRMPALVGESPAMQEVYKLIGALTVNRVTVLIEGESGVGKENAARAIHFNSPIRDKPFMPVNCGAFAEDLLESELFGHEKGSFTGADRQTSGVIGAAEDGTLFLDEIVCASPGVQVRLLRALQEREYQRVGGTESLPVRARVIAATNYPLEEAARDGLFRWDLYYRLKVVSVQLPPLRERKEDIPALTEHFLAKTAKELGRRSLAVDEAAAQALQECPWPGNVRELENAIRHAAVFARSGVLLKEHLPAGVLNPAQLLDGQEPLTARMMRRAVESLAEEAPPGEMYQAALNELERALIANALKTQGGNQVKAAHWLGISRTTLRRRIEELSIPIPPRAKGRGK